MSVNKDGISLFKFEENNIVYKYFGNIVSINYLRPQYSKIYILS